MVHQRGAKERDPDSTRQAILSAAEEEFAQKGFSGARIDEIAARSGYNKSLIFHYFVSKMGLYHAVIAAAKGHIDHQIYSTLLASLETDEPMSAAQVRAFIRQGITNYFDFLVARPTLQRILAWEAAEGWISYRSEPLIYENTQEKFRIFVTFLRRAQAEGYIHRDLDPVMFIVTIMGMSLIYLNSLPRYETMFPDTDFLSPAALATAREHLISLILDGAMTSSTLGVLE